MSLRNGTLIVADNAMQTAMHSALTQDATMPPRSVKKGKNTLDEIEVTGVVSGGEKCFLCEVDETGKKIHVYSEQSERRTIYSKTIAGMVTGQNLLSSVYLLEQTKDVPEDLTHGYLCLVIEPIFPFGTKELSSDEKAQHCTLQFFADDDIVFYIYQCEGIVPLAEITKEIIESENAGEPNETIITCIQIYNGGDMTMSTTQSASKLYQEKKYVIPEKRILPNPANETFYPVDKIFGVDTLNTNNKNFHVDVFKFEYHDPFNRTNNATEYWLFPYKDFRTINVLYGISGMSYNFYNALASIQKYATLKRNDIYYGKKLFAGIEETLHGISEFAEQTYSYSDVGTFTMSYEIVAEENSDPVVFIGVKKIIIYSQEFHTYATHNVTCDEMEIDVDSVAADNKSHYIYATITYENDQFTAQYQDTTNENNDFGENTFAFKIATYSKFPHETLPDKSKCSITFHDSNLYNFNLTGVWLC